MTTDQGNPLAALVAEGLARLTEAAETMQFRATAGAALGAALDLDDERLVATLDGLDREQLRKVFAAATAVGVATMRALDDERHEPTTDEAVRGVQAWMALDLHQALDLPADHRAEVTHQGRRSWGDWWAELLGRVRQMRARADALAVDLDNANDTTRRATERAEQAEAALQRAHDTHRQACPGMYACPMCAALAPAEDPPVTT